MKKWLQLLTIAAALIAVVSCQSVTKIKDAKTDNKDSSEGPKLTRPVIKKIWVPETIEDDGRVLVEGHYKWLLEKDSTWSR